MEVLLLAERIEPRRALEMGLVNAVVPRDQVLPKALEWAETICKNGPLAVRSCKESAKRSTLVDLMTALETESTYSTQVFSSEDAKEGVAAFREKRPPVWKGR